MQWRIAVENESRKVLDERMCLCLHHKVIPGEPIIPADNGYEHVHNYQLLRLYLFFAPALPNETSQTQLPEHIL